MTLRLALLAILALCTASVLLTQSYFKNRGVDVTDGIFEEIPNYNFEVDTKCSQLNFSRPGTPYDYNGTVMSGYLKVGKGNSVLAFVLYGKEHVEKSKLKDVPTIIWLNGGPGSSSQMGNLMELGPFWIKQSQSKAYEIVRNEFAWTQEYNILFMDQPVGTGLSYADSQSAYCKDQECVANDFYEAMKELYNNPSGCFNRLNIIGTSPLIMFGESYAGKYVPAIAMKILTEEKNGGFLKGLKGIAIGDGFTAPFDTLSMMGEFAYNFGLLDYMERTQTEQILLNASYQFDSSAFKDLHKSFSDTLNIITESTGGVNVYDITKYKAYPNQLLYEYFWNQQTEQMYGLEPNFIFDIQKNNVYEALYEDFMKDEIHQVSGVLMTSKVKVLVYTGQNDLIVETPGTFKWVERLFYNEHKEFRDKLLNVWKVDNKTMGYNKMAGNLELRTVNNAGHLIPMDQGKAALHMVKEFVSRSLKTPMERQE